MRKFKRGWQDGRKVFFSKVGRLTLIRSVMNGILVYYMPLFRIPSSEKYMRDFLGRGVTKVMGPIC